MIQSQKPEKFSPASYNFRFRSVKKCLDKLISLSVLHNKCSFPILYQHKYVFHKPLTNFSQTCFSLISFRDLTNKLKHLKSIYILFYFLNLLRLLNFINITWGKDTKIKNFFSSVSNNKITVKLKAQSRIRMYDS